MTEPTDARKDILDWLEKWSDSSLEALIRVYRGEGGQVSHDAHPDPKVRRFFALMEQLRSLRRFDDIDEIYAEVERLCRDFDE